MRKSSINVKKALIIGLVASASILLVFFSIPLNPPQPVEACGAYSGGGGDEHQGGWGGWGGHGDQGGNQQGGNQQGGGGQQGGNQQGGGRH